MFLRKSIVLGKMGSSSGGSKWIDCIADYQLGLCLAKARGIILGNQEQRMSVICSMLAEGLYLMIPIVYPVLAFHRNYLDLLYALVRLSTCRYRRRAVTEGQSDEDLEFISLLIHILPRERRRITRICEEDSGPVLTLNQIYRHYRHHINFVLEFGRIYDRNYMALSDVIRWYSAPTMILRVGSEYTRENEGTTADQEPALLSLPAQNDEEVLLPLRPMPVAMNGEGDISEEDYPWSPCFPSYRLISTQVADTTMNVIINNQRYRLEPLTSEEVMILMGREGGEPEPRQVICFIGSGGSPLLR